MLYTPMITSDLFPTEEKQFARHQCISYKGKPLYVEQLEDGSYQLLQLLSSNPQDYLDDSLSPGTILR